MSESHQRNMVQEAIQQVTVTNSQPVRERDKEIIKTERRGPTSAGMHWQMGSRFLFFGSPLIWSKPAYLPCWSELFSSDNLAATLLLSTQRTLRA